VKRGQQKANNKEGWASVVKEAKVLEKIVELRSK
jgi:hypothetical protein